MKRRVALGLFGFLVLLGGCAMHRTHVMHEPLQSQEPLQSLAVTTSNRSTIYLERVDGGIVVVDLGWRGAEAALADGLRQMDAGIDDVVAVFLTHSHRDHIGAWRSVRQAPFHLAASEVALLFGHREHGGWIPRTVDRLRSSDLPQPGDVVVRPFSADTSVAFGRDTVRVFMVSGHTAGSAAYLIRGRLFAGDAVSRTWWRGFGPARRGYSDDAAEARRSLESLRQRLDPYTVHVVCTAHFQCSEATDAFWEELLGG